MTDYRILHYRGVRGDRVGIAIAGSGSAPFDAADVLDAADLTGVHADADIATLFADWAGYTDRVERALAAGTDVVHRPIGDLELLAPAPLTTAIYGAGANYYGHALEMAEHAGRPVPKDPRTTGQQPWHFLKAPRTLTGHGATVAVPALAPDTLDWEVELVAVIGEETRNVSAAEALERVAGYTVGNDLSARGMLWRKGLAETSPFRSDWVLHKNFDGSCPLGPWIVPAGQIGDPQQLGLGLSVNGEEKQIDNTSDMIFTIAEQIAHLSQVMTLYPGDLVLSGTPGGVGNVLGQYLQPGDVVDAWVEGIGTLTTKIS